MEAGLNSDPGNDSFWDKIRDAITGLEKSFLCLSQNFSGRARVPFFWSHFLSSWSQSCAKTQKFRRKKKKEAIFEASFCAHVHPNMNIINEMMASSFFFLVMKIDEKQRKKRRKLLERTWVHFILMKPGEEGAGVVE